MSRPLFLAVPAYERLGTSCNSVFCKPRLYQVAISAPRPRRDHFHREARPRIAVSYPTEGNSQELVYFATFPLIGLESLEGAINFAGGELPEFMAQHCAVIVERPSEGVSATQSCGSITWRETSRCCFKNGAFICDSIIRSAFILQVRESNQL